MNQNIQDIADKVTDNIAAKAIDNPDPAKISAEDHAEILNDILGEMDVLFSAVAPTVPEGAEWYTAPGTPTYGATSVTETASAVLDGLTIYNVSSSEVSVPYAAAGKKRIDAIVVVYGSEASFYTRIEGAEVDVLAVAGTPNLDPTNMFVRWVYVTDGAIAAGPSGAVYSVSINGGTPNYPGPTGNVDLEIEFEVQDSLDYNGTGTYVPTVDAVNDALSRNTKLFASTGITHKNDTFELTVLDSTTVRILACDTVVFWDELFVSGQVTDDSFKSFPQKDYPLSQLITATGGNVNLNPLVTDGIYVRYLGYDIDQNIVSSASNFLYDTDIAQLGFVTVIKSGSSVTFLGGTTPGARNVFSQPMLASTTELDRTLVQPTSDVVIGFNTGAASLNSSDGSITGLSINWKGVSNPGNLTPIDKFSYTGLATVTFASINPAFLTQTSAPTPHTLWTETEGGIAINNSFWNTTTSARATLDNNKFSVKRVLIGLRGGIYIQDGEHATTAGYATIDEAKAALSSHVFTESIIPPGVVVEIARIAFKKGVTNFATATEFYITSTFSGAAGSGSGTTYTDAQAIAAGITNIGTGATNFAAGNHTHSNATTSTAGFMSAADKTKLDAAQSDSATLFLTPETSPQEFPVYGKFLSGSLQTFNGSASGNYSYRWKTDGGTYSSYISTIASLTTALSGLTDTSKTWIEVTSTYASASSVIIKWNK